MQVQPTEIAGTDSIRTRILHLLTVYPRISPSMLQIGIGTSVPPTIWRPILDELVKDHKVMITSINIQSPAGRTRSYQVVSLESPMR